MSKDGRDYFELAEPWSSLRLCRELEKKFPDLRGNQLELLKFFCLVAYNSQNYRGMCGDAWLRTTISLKSENESQHVLSAESFECREMARIMSLNSNERDVELRRLIQGQILPDIASKIEIKSTILPRGAYLERLKELDQRQSCWAKVQRMLMGTLCCASGREFYPKSILYQACERNVSLKERVNEWRRNRGRCDLAIHLQIRDYSDCLIPIRTALRKIPIAEVKVVGDLIGKGSEGSIQQVLWRDGTYAMKSCTTTFETEEKVALRVLHPHVATAFGCSFVDRYGYLVRCLLMEVMAGDLFRLTIEKDVTSDIKPPLSRVDSLDVLLQVGMAMDYMHTNNVVHGDLKPHNILISPFEVSGNERYFLAKVTDFGCAKFITPVQNLQILGSLGTPAYAAPEVLRREKDFKHPEKIDVYNFGAVAYEVLTGHEVYDGKLDSSDWKSIKSGHLRPSNSEGWKTLIEEHRYPLELIKLVEKCLEWDPKERPTFSDILAIIKDCKSTVQWGSLGLQSVKISSFARSIGIDNGILARWQEKRAAAIWKVFVAVCLFAFVYYFTL